MVKSGRSPGAWRLTGASWLADISIPTYKKSPRLDLLGNISILLNSVFSNICSRKSQVVLCKYQLVSGFAWIESVFPSTARSGGNWGFPATDHGIFRQELRHFCNLSLNIQAKTGPCCDIYNIIIFHTIFQQNWAFLLYIITYFDRHWGIFYIREYSRYHIIFRQKLGDSCNILVSIAAETGAFCNI
jgi:hypothetical protein